MDAPVYLPYEQFAEVRRDRTPVPVFSGLWGVGSIEPLAMPCIAIVGTRAASGYGIALAKKIGGELARAGCCIVSGLALGIDAAAHSGALDCGGATIGVLGGGHGAFFPRRNRSLAERMIAARGAVLSPYPPGQPAHPPQFLERNGIVAALCDAVVVIEAPARSGALNTAGWAAGRIPVFAVPGDVDRPHVAGCHALIRDGAILARSAQDVLDDLRLSARAPEQIRAASEEPRADPLQESLLRALRGGEAGLETLLDQTQSAPAAVLAALSMLELQGTIEARAGQRYSLR